MQAGVAGQGAGAEGAVAREQLEAAEVDVPELEARADMWLSTESWLLSSRSESLIPVTSRRRRRAALRGVYQDLALMEDILRDSGLDWTVVRPPRLTDGPLTGAYRAAGGRNLRGGLFVSRADVAHLMLAVLDRPATVGHALGIAS